MNTMKSTLTREVIAIVSIAALALASFAFVAGTAEASGGSYPYYFGNKDNDITVSTSNGANVVNNVTVKANTGMNDADGGNSDDGGNGGNANGYGYNYGGHGGNGGNAGWGGLITTGPAGAGSSIMNNVNNNNIGVTDSCGCGGTSKYNDIIVSTSNSATVNNGVTVKANTGMNDADGGNSDDGGNGGNANGYGYPYPWEPPYYPSTNIGGNGGNGGHAGPGGTIHTGMADAWSGITNLVNHNLVRVTR